MAVQGGGAVRTCASWPVDVPDYVAEAVAVVDRALALWPNGELALSFNGGKDCTILLGLVQLSEARRKQRLAAEGNSLSDDETSALFTSRVRMVYFVEEGCFPEQDEFIELAQRTYGFELQRVGQHMKENTAMLVRDHGVRAFLMGTRRADPYAATLDNFSPSTDGWAPFMRVNPVLEWEYDMVWQFIRDFSIPYCSLYDKGYSSVGLMNNTERNQNLVRPDGTYRPAWELDRTRADTERGGRGRKESSNSTTGGGGGGGSSGCDSAKERLATAAVGGGERRSIALLLASEVVSGDSTGTDGGRCGAEELWVRIRKPLNDRSYSVNAICTLSDGAEQWAAALAQHTQTSRVVLAVAPASTLQTGLAMAFGADRTVQQEPSITRARVRGPYGSRGELAPAATRWTEMLPGSVLLDKNGAVVLASRESAEDAGEPASVAASRQLARMEEVVAVVYRSVVCCPVASQQSADVEAAIGAVCAAADSESGPIGLL